ncbi:glycosyltransferase [Paenalcaligenes sp. Me131]|uniref:glycosyltransferase n=1 Tax=Paenalcaligenes sp. Me131 TaxID=3392636 RepID=UPI003D2A2278
MIKNVEISVVIPVYNVEKYLPDLINSLTKQTNPNFEFIFVNDGSTDSSEAIVVEACHADSRFRIINKENGGLSSARNTGIKHAVGTWICFIDSDDWITPDSLQRLLAQAKEQEVDVIIGNGFRFTNNPEESVRNPLLTKQPWGDTLDGKQWIIRSVELKEWPHFAWLQLIKRDVILSKNLQFIEGMVHEDILWTTNLALQVSKIGFVQEPFYGYRQNQSSITGSTSVQSIYRRANSYIEIIRALAKKSLETDDIKLRKSLLLQANRECGHFFALIRKKLTAHKIRKELAKKFIALGLPSIILKERSEISAFWLTFRCFLVCYFYALRRY